MRNKVNPIKTLSSPEVELLSRLEFEGKEIITRQDIAGLCADKTRAPYLIKKLLEKKRLRTIIKNIYLLVPMKAPPGQWAGNGYLIAKALARGADYYIGYSSVFNSYGFTEQVSQMVHVVNGKYSMEKTIFGVRYKFIKTLPNRFYGLQKRKIQNEDVIFPDRERALIDVFEFYDTAKAGGILREQLSKVYVPIFAGYVARYPVQTIRRRIGYFLETLGADKKLLAKISAGDKGYSPLYSGRSNRGPLNKRWRVIING